MSDTSNLHASRRPPGRREELLAAALAAIRRVGPAASMDDMAAQAGITKPVLYRYFGDREGLIGAVAARFADELAGQLAAALTTAGEDPEALLAAGVSCYVGFIEEDPSLYGFLSREAAPGSPALVALVDRVAAVIAEVMAGRFRSAGLASRPVLTYSYGIVGMVHLAGARWARRPDCSREELVADLVALAARGLTGAAESLQLR